MPTAPILIVDDEPDIRSSLADILEDEGYAVASAANADEARDWLASRRAAAILLDIWMPGTDGLALLREWVEAGGLAQPVIMMSGHGTLETAVEATRLGAYDFIEKPIALAKLLITLERALEASRLRASNEQLREAARTLFEPRGESPAFRAVLSQLELLAGREAAILLRGEPGTGKEALARWLHARSDRRDGPFVTIAAGAVPDEQAAVALFGSESGHEVSPGLLEQASGGMLFLDEIAELGAELQLRLSSALERREILRIGGRQPLPIDVRVMASSSQDLEAARHAGQLRDELYFQLNVVPIRVPPLRDRSADIEALAEHFAQVFASRDGLPPRRWPAATLARLRQHDWPGNVRELRGLVQRLALLDTGEVTSAEIEAALQGQSPAAVHQGDGDERIDLNLDLPLREARDAFERAYLARQLEQAGGSVSRLAELSGMERTHLYRKLRDLDIDLRGQG